jgi:putative ABC transport system permease protein
MAAIGAFWARSFLYGMSPLDPVAYLQVIALLMASAALATWVPARRATRVNPADTLRAE